MAEYHKFVGLDVHKKTIAIAVADSGRKGEVRSYGEIANSPAAILRAFKKIAGKDRLLVCYEAGPCGYRLFRQLKQMGHDCQVIAPALIPTKVGDRVKTDARDAVQLARLLRAGELTAIAVPDERQEALRDLTRAREDSKEAQRIGRQKLKAFLLRNGLEYQGSTKWSPPFFRWLAGLTLADSAQRVVLEEYIHAVRETTDRTERITRQIEEFCRARSEVAPAIRAFEGLRGVSTVTAATVAAELGDLTRFGHPKQLMAFCGLVPSEHSSGDRIRRGGITKTGNRHVRRVLVESAWAYRHPPRVGPKLLKRQEGLPKPLIDISWRAQIRLCAKYRRLTAKGKSTQHAVTAVARELVGYLWESARESKNRDTAKLLYNVAA